MSEATGQQALRFLSEATGQQALRFSPLDDPLGRG